MPCILECEAEVSLGVLSWAFLSADPAALTELRRRPPAYRGQPLPSNQLKHADDQAVLSLAAVVQAAEKVSLDFRDWAVLAAPRFLGRADLEPLFHKFQQEGAWSVSPHTIPHRCLHSVSGLISFLLKMQGHNFGCGGGPGGDAESVLAAAALLATESLPGAWLVLTGNSPERLPGSAEGWVSHALALALTADGSSPTQANLHIAKRPAATPASLPRTEKMFLQTLAQLLQDPPTAGYGLELGTGGLEVRIEPPNARGHQSSKAA